MDETSPPESSKATTSTQKQPPPEPVDAIRTRQLVIFSFWAIILFLGLPTWWKTTSIYRAQLPLQLMEEWADGKQCKPTFPLRIAVEATPGPASVSAPPMAPRILQHLIKNTQHALDDLNDFPIHHIRLLTSELSTTTSSESIDPESEIMIPIPDDIALLMRLIPIGNGQPPSAKLHTYSPVLDVFYSSNMIPTEGSSFTSPLAMFIAKELQSIFTEEQATIAHALSMTSWGAPNKNRPELAESLTKRSTRSFKYAPAYYITFSLFTPTSVPFDWDIEGALEKHITPLLSSLSSISNFTTDSQVQLYAGFTPSIKPEYDADKNSWSLSRDDLSGFINAAEWPLSPNMGAGPTINFILYVPAAHQSPLVVRHNEGGDPSNPDRSNSWLIPQWGGVQILNLHKSSAGVISYLTKDDLESSMRTFSTQLLSLLGLPNSPSSLPMRLSTLTRVHAASLIYSASSTIGALARLTRTLPSIAIPNQVASSVDRSISHLSAACSSLSNGKFASALEEARIAEQEAEKAFFERSMVAQVYFPDEHKAVMYVPLIGTIAVPLVTSAVREIRRWRKGGK
ncbi:GPI transamidase component PIG-S [Microthyrium microscopicum]|uniref:GPI transamidase component PIG-S n=1 Tax=Microthyrium microscopicum TaxID=703497 RepID=A0A6A6UTY9_9PEZI|nr:GPI transamidase component PIG-S [Microthyrium microscopicum]